MSAEIRRELERLSIEIDAIKKSTHFISKKIPKKVKVKRYHALLSRISKSPEVDTTPDELISSLKRKEY